MSQFAGKRVRRFRRRQRYTPVALPCRYNCGTIWGTLDSDNTSATARKRCLYYVLLAEGVPGHAPPCVVPPAELLAKIKARILSPFGEKLAILVEKKTVSRLGIWTTGGLRLVKHYLRQCGVS